MFIDEAEIDLEGGHGGAGLVSFGKKMWSGPDGGNGGKGGDIFFVAKADITLLNQFIIKKVDHDLLAKMFRTDLPAPIVKVAKPITYGSNKFQISFDETQLPINKFPFVKGVRVLRRQLDDSNNAINDFVLLDEIMFAEGDLTQSGIFMALSYNFIDTSVNNYRAQQYRVVPINAQKENGIRFTDAKINQLINPDNTIKNQTQSLNSNVLLDGVQSQIAKEVSITVSNIALGIESASLKRRNMTSVEREHKIIDIKKINNSSVSFTDKTAQINMIYEYIVDLKDMRDNTVSSDNVFLIKILPESQKKAIKTEIINPRVVKHSNRFDIIAVGLEPPTITSQLATKIKAAILSPGGGLFPSPSDSLKEAYEDILKQEEFTENVGFVPIHKVSRINMTTNQLEMSKFIEGNTYTEADTLNSAHDYQYKVETAVVDIDKIIKGISDPKLFETIGNVEKETGTLPPTNSTFTESEILDKSLGLQQVIVPFNSKQNTVEIQNLVANKINKKNISIKWRMNDIGKRVDYLVVERKYDDFNFTTIGNTVEKYFTDVLTPELETSRLEYRITPILTSGGSGIAASVIIQEKKAKKLKSSSRFVSSKARIQTPSATITMADTAKQIDDKRNKSKDIENEKV